MCRRRSALAQYVSGLGGSSLTSQSPRFLSTRAAAGSRLGAFGFKRLPALPTRGRDEIALLAFLATGQLVLVPFITINLRQVVTLAIEQRIRVLVSFSPFWPFNLIELDV
jgi:hypothetical protein